MVMGKPFTENFDFQLDLYKRLESYQYLEIYLRTARFVKDKKTGAQLNMDKNEKEAIVNFYNVADIAFHSEVCKIFEIDKDLKPMLEDTKPSYKDLHLPYPVIFVSEKFEVGHFLINGFLLIDIKYFYEHYNTDFASEDADIMLLSVALNTKGRYEFYSSEPLTEKRSPKARDYFDTTDEYADMVKAAKLMNRMACNLIQTIINDEKDIEQVPINYTEEHNRKRLLKGKQPFRNKIILRLGGTLKQYARHYCEHRGSIQARHLVMGHYRRFLSDRYKNMKGKKLWIRPYFAGMGESVLKKFVEVKI